MQNLDSGRKDRAVGLPGWQVSLLSALTQARDLPVFAELHRDASEQSWEPQASLKGNKPVKNKNLFGDECHFINKNISVPEGPDVSKSCFRFRERFLEGANQNSTVPSGLMWDLDWDFCF